MRYQPGRVEPCAHHFERFDHIGRIAAARTHDVRVGIVHVVEVERGLEVGLGRACEEVQASVERQDRVCLFHYRHHRGEDEHVVITFAARERFQFGGRVGHCAGVHVFQLDTVLGGLFGRIERCGAVETALVDIGHDD